MKWLPYTQPDGLTNILAEYIVVGNRDKAKELCNELCHSSQDRKFNSAAGWLEFMTNLAMTLLTTAPLIHTNRSLVFKNKHDDS